MTEYPHRERPYVKKREIHDAMTRLEDENDSVGSRYGRVFDDLRKELDMETYE